MDLGIPWWVGAGDPAKGIRQTAELDLDFLEISLDAPWPDDLNASTLHQAAEEEDIELGFHGPWRTQALAHPREPLAQAARDVAQDCIDFAREAGGSYIVFHIDARDFGRFPEKRPVERGLQQAQASLRALARSAGQAVRVVVENTSSPMGTPSEVADFLDVLPSVEFCYDPGHAALVEDEQIEDATSDPARWTDALGDRLALLHVMDRTRVDGRLVDHLVPGEGDADWASEVEAAQEVGCSRVLMEAFYRAPDKAPARAADLAAGRDRLRSLA